MTDPVLVAARFLFFLLGGVSLVLPLRWALFSYLLLTQVSVFSPGFASATSVGWENAAKVLLIPTVLLIRYRWAPHSPTQPVELSRWWLALVAYVILASLWSPFPLSAVKMIGYLYCYSVLFLLFRHAWRESWFTQGFLVANLYFVLGLAIVQTYIFHGFFSADGRFSTFSDGQSTAAYLICMLTLLLFHRRKGVIYWIALFSALCGILLTGSRYVFIGLAVLILLSPFGLFEQSSQPNFAKRAKMMAAALLGIFLMGGYVVRFAPENRLNQLIEYTLSQSASYEDVGTLAWRMLIYQSALQELQERNGSRWFFGSGTSSSADVLLEVDRYSYTPDDVDGNRSMHDEFLRAFYEWGVPGFVFFVFFLASTLVFCLKKAIRQRCKPAWAYLAIFPTLLLGLTFENILANAGQPAGTGYLLVLTYSATAR